MKNRKYFVCYEGMDGPGLFMLKNGVWFYFEAWNLEGWLLWPDTMDGIELVEFSSLEEAIEGLGKWGCRDSAIEYFI